MVGVSQRCVSIRLHSGRCVSEVCLNYELTAQQVGVSQRYVSIRIDCTGGRCVSEVCLNKNLWIDQPKEEGRQCLSLNPNMQGL